MNDPSTTLLDCFKTNIYIFIFTPVKRRIYGISLLLSYLIVLSHQVISHHHDHHYDVLAEQFSIILEKVNDHGHDHEEDSDETYSHQDHKHPFPVHQHYFTTDDIDYTRTYVSESSLKIRSVTSFFVSHIFFSGFSDPPDFTLICFGDPPFLKTSLFDPGATTLRGPPSLV